MTADRHRIGGVLVVGSLNLDLVATAPRLPRGGETITGTSYAEHAGGKGLNQAVAAARAGATVQLIGAIGSDEAGRQLLAVATEAGIDTRSILHVEGAPTGRALISVDEAGENCIIVVPGANGQLTAKRAGQGVEATSSSPLVPSVLLVQLEIPITAVTAALTAAQAGGAVTILDPAPAADLPDSLLATVDVIAPNEHEVELLGGVDRLLGAGVGAVLVSLGAEGAVLHRAEHAPVHQPAFTIEAVDTTGAGDAFRGAFAARVAAGASYEAALPYAAAAGALAASSPGAVPSLPTASAIETLLAR